METGKGHYALVQPIPWILHFHSGAGGTSQWASMDLETWYRFVQNCLLNLVVARLITPHWKMSLWFSAAYINGKRSDLLWLISKKHILDWAESAIEKSYIPLVPVRISPIYESHWKKLGTLCETIRTWDVLYVRTSSILIYYKDSILLQSAQFMVFCCSYGASFFHEYLFTTGKRNRFF